MCQVRSVVCRASVFVSVFACLLLPALLLPGSAQAFKIDMHVWVAQQVLNDLTPDGRLTIEPYGSFEVDPAIVAALRDYADEYRMGSIGPDGFPDLVGGQMTVHPGVPGGWLTDRWLAWMLEGVQTSRQRAFAYGYLTHAAGDVFAHTYVNTYTGDFFDLADGQEAEVRHMVLEQFMKEHMPPIRDGAGNILHAYQIVEAPAAFLRDRLILNPTVANQYRKQPGTLYLALMYDYWVTIGEIVDELKQFRQDAKNVIDDIQDEIDSLDDRIDDLKDIKITIWGKTFKLYPAYCFIDPGTCTVIWSLELALGTTKLALEFPKYVHDGILYSLQKPMEAWQGEVEEALKQYMITSQEIAIEIMKPSWPDGEEKNCFDDRYASPKCKLDAWVCEWAPVFAGVPNEATVPACSVGSALARAKKLQQDVFDGISDFRSGLVEPLGPFGWAVDPGIKLQELIDDRIKPKFEDLALEITESLLTSATGENSLTLDLLEFRTEEHTEIQLNNIFAGDSSGKGLLLIPDLVDRVKWEMNLDAQDYWDPEQYNVVHNAIVLSKLLLLGPGQLNSLVKKAGISTTIYGDDLYWPSSFKNIMVDAIASIDGNHQWQEIAPPSPRQAGFTDLKSDDDRRYGYPFDGRKGFRLWQDCQVRDKVFNNIFRGPLAPGIEEPLTPPFADLLVAGDQNHTSPDDPMYPFPLSSGSSLPLKVTADDSEGFDLDGWAAAGGRLGDIWNNLGLTHSRKIVAVRPVELSPGISARKLILELNSHVCGGQNGAPVTTDWSFVDQCQYDCECRLVIDRILGLSYSTCGCTSATCESKVFRTLAEIQDDIVHDFTIGDDDCSICHNNDGRLNPGKFSLTSRGSPVTTADGPGIEWDGALICDTSAPETNLVMPAVDTKEVRVRVVNPVTQDNAVGESIQQTNYPEMTAFEDWRDVDNAIIQSTNGQEGACGLIALVDEEDFAADVTPPTIEAPVDINLSCGDYQAAVDADQSIEEILGSPLVMDDRDGAPQVTHNAPATLPVGDIVVIWTTTDSAGNTASAQQVVVIRDELAPVFTDVLAPVNVVSTGGDGTAVALPIPIASDACEGAIPATTSAALDKLPIGRTDVTWVAADSSGNRATTMQIVTVSDMPGDMNGDGKVDQSDLNMVLDALSQPAIGQAELDDFNGNGVIDEADEAVFALMQQGSNDPRDADGDGKIGADDAQVVQGLCAPDCEILQIASDLYGRGKPGKVNVVWSVVDGYNYRVLRADKSDGPYSLIGTSGSGVFMDANVTSGTEYYYVVQADNAVARSVFSNEASIYVPAERRR